MLTGGKSRASGFSLIELMIALTLGLIVLGAVLTFTVTMIRAYSENIQSTRLTQELRTSMNIIAREIRRAGFDSRSVTRVLTDINPSTFNAMTVTDTCVSYEYDRGVGGPGGVPGTSEVRGVRLNAETGTVQMNATTAAIDCDADDGWVDVTDPSVVQVTAFAPTLIDTPFCSQVGETTDPVTGDITYHLAQGSVRHLTLCLKGRLVADNTIARQITNTTRVRAEEVSFIDSTAACPAVVSGALLTPAALNTECEETL